MFMRTYKKTALGRFTGNDHFLMQVSYSARGKLSGEGEI